MRQIFLQLLLQLTIFERIYSQGPPGGAPPPGGDADPPPILKPRNSLTTEQVEKDIVKFDRISEKISSSNYTLETGINQLTYVQLLFLGWNLDLDYSWFFQVFEGKLFRYDDNGISFVIEEFKLKQDEIYPSNGCQYYWRDVIIQETGQMQFRLHTSGKYIFNFVDFTTVGDQYIIATDQYELFLMRQTVNATGFIQDVSKDSVEYSFKEQLAILPEFESGLNLQMGGDNDLVYIFTNKGSAVLFNLQSKLFTKLPEIRTREVIRDVKVYQKYIFVAAGSEGIDVYTMVNSTFAFYITLDSDFFGYSKVGNDIRDIKVDTSYGFLYALDFNVGLFQISIGDSLIKINTFMNAQYGFKFDYYNNTFIILCQSGISSQYFTYAIEIFSVPLEKNSRMFNKYYYNRYFDEIESDIYNVHMEQDHGIFITSQSQIVFEHSVYRNFMTQFFESYHPAFRSRGLMKLKRTTGILEDGQYSMVGLKKNGLVAFRANKYPPKVMCSFEDPGEYNFILAMNATDCLFKYDEADTYEQGKSTERMASNFFMCQTQHKFQIIVNETEDDEGQMAAIIGMVIGLFIFCIAVTVFLIFYSRSQKKKQQLKDQQITKLEKLKLEKVRKESTQIPQQEFNPPQNKAEQITQQIQQKESAYDSETKVEKEDNYQIDDQESEVKYDQGSNQEEEISVESGQ